MKKIVLRFFRDTSFVIIFYLFTLCTFSTAAIYSDINVKGNNYYYNILTRKLFDLKGFYKGKLEKGKLVLI